MGQYRVESAWFSSVLLPLLPEDNYMPRILICGYENAFKINLGEGKEHKWEPINRDIDSIRLYNIATILPTGDILVTGGTAEHGVDSTAEKHAETYQPGIDFTTGLYSKQDKMVADPHDELQNVEATNARGYHYVALYHA